MYSYFDKREIPFNSYCNDKSYSGSIGDTSINEATYVISLHTCEFSKP